MDSTVIFEISRKIKFIWLDEMCVHIFILTRLYVALDCSFILKLLRTAFCFIEKSHGYKFEKKMQCILPLTSNINQQI